LAVSEEDDGPGEQRKQETQTPEPGQSTINKMMA
jgi:hypothetical protein